MFALFLAKHSKGWQTYHSLAMRVGHKN